MAILAAALSLPNTPGFKRVNFSAVKVAASSDNPFTLTQQIQEWDGERLGASVTLPPMSRADGEEWVGALLALRGITNTFMLRLPTFMQTPRGTALGAPVLDGAHAAGAKVISTKGWTANQAAALKAGDWIQIGNYLRKILAAEGTDVNGKASFDIFPSLPMVFGNGEPIVKNNPQGIFRLASNKFTWDVGDGGIYNIAFEAIEAL
jgi:hypothetical protein